MFIIADDQCVVGLSRNVAKTSEDHTFLIEVSFTVSSLGVFLKSQVVEVTVSVHAARSEAHVVVEPIN